MAPAEGVRTDPANVHAQAPLRRRDRLPRLSSRSVPARDTTIAVKTTVPGPMILAESKPSA
jgi:hypothetical protein